MPEDGNNKNPSSGTISPEEEPKIKVLSFEETRSSIPKVKVLAVGEIIPKAETTAPKKVQVVLPNAVIRERVKIELSELANVDQGIQGEETLIIALSLIQNFNLDDSREEKFTTFGHDIQQQYSEEVQKLFALMNNQAVSEIKLFIDRIVTIMQEFNPEKILEPPNSIFSLFKKEKKNKQTIKGEIEQAYLELEKLIAQAKDNLPELGQIKIAVDLFESNLPYFLEQIESKILAGKFLINHGQKIAQEKPEKEKHRLETALTLFEKRIESLAISRVTILQGLEQVKLFRSSIIGLTANIENALLTMVPLWYSGYLNALAVEESQRAGKNTSITSDLFKLQAAIVNNLKGE